VLQGITPWAADTSPENEMANPWLPRKTPICESCKEDAVGGSEVTKISPTALAAYGFSPTPKFNCVTVVVWPAERLAGFSPVIPCKPWAFVKWVNVEFCDTPVANGPVTGQRR
jgi:hypothetical protein